MEGKVWVRRFSWQGSTVQELTRAEAERVVEEALHSGSLVLDEDTEERLVKLTPEVGHVFIIRPIAGGGSSRGT